MCVVGEKGHQSRKTHLLGRQNRDGRLGRQRQVVMMVAQVGFGVLVPFERATDGLGNLSVVILSLLVEVMRRVCALQVDVCVCVCVCVDDTATETAYLHS